MNLKFKTYKELIDYAKNETRIKGDGKYYELHHIVPVFLGGTNDKSNLILLTLYEHVLAHYLLAIENENNKKIYAGNINSAWLIFHARSSYKNKKQEIENWLKNEDAQKLTEDIKVRLAKVGKENLKKARASRNFSDRIWVQKIGKNAAPQRMLERSLGKGCWVGYEKIPDCPICHKPNSDDSFACCKEHEADYKAELREKVKQVQAKNSKNMWKKPEVRNKISEANIGKKHASNGIWITNGIENRMIKHDELESYLKLGWKKGRIATSGWKQSEEVKQKLSERRKQCCYVYNDTIDCKEIKKEELEEYLANGWKQGRRDGKPRLNVKQPKMGWVSNEHETIRVRVEKIPEYLAKGYTRGRQNQVGKSFIQPKMAWINDGVSRVERVREEIAKEYLAMGWKRGRTF